MLTVEKLIQNVMIVRLLLLVVVAQLFVMGCSIPSSEDLSLDSGIPRVETPGEQIAYVRTKWINEKQVETAFLDRQDRVLEVFRFGRSSAKTRHRYEGSKNSMTIHYAHSDSSPMGWVSVDTLRRTFDAEGRVIIEFWANGSISEEGVLGSTGHSERHLSYTAKSDTLVRGVKSSYDTTNPSTVVNIDRWEKDDDQQRLGRHYRLYVMKQLGRINDTVYHFSQRFAYDSTGKLALAWFDHMNLGRFYMPAGPDTIRYRYDSQNRLVEEKHIYTTDMSNKSEPDTAGLANSSDETAGFYRNKFFVGDKYFSNNNRTDLVTYQYEVFDPEKHLPMKIPIVD